MNCLLVVKVCLTKWFYHWQCNQHASWVYTNFGCPEAAVPNIATGWFAFVLHIREVLSSGIGSKTRHSVWFFRDFPQSPQANMCTDWFESHQGWLYCAAETSLEGPLLKISRCTRNKWMKEKKINLQPKSLILLGQAVYLLKSVFISQFWDYNEIYSL
jgi:hypothetical protein